MKCKNEKCKQCGPCKEQSASGETETDACPSECAKNTLPWSIKCNKYGRCKQCEPCKEESDSGETETEACPSECAKNRLPWSRKCKEEKCKQCGPCKAQTEVEVEDEQGGGGGAHSATMVLKDPAGGCKARGWWLGRRGATVEGCKRACLANDKCNFATVVKNRNPKKWKCAAYTECKKARGNKMMITFKKSKAVASTAELQADVWTD